MSGLGSVRIVKNCDLGLENAALCLRPRAAFSRPRSQFFPIRTSQPADNIYLFERLFKVKKNGVLLFGISFFVLEIFTFLYYANEESDDVIGGST